jgi:hypothetical protein
MSTVKLPMTSFMQLSPAKAKANAVKSQNPVSNE